MQLLVLIIPSLAEDLGQLKILRYMFIVCLCEKVLIIKMRINNMYSIHSRNKKKKQIQIQIQSFNSLIPSVTRSRIPHMCVRVFFCNTIVSMSVNFL